MAKRKNFGKGTTSFPALSGAADMAQAQQPEDHAQDSAHRPNNTQYRSCYGKAFDANPLPSH